MPYRHAHWYILALIPASVLAFLPYLLDLGEANFAIHVHSITATLWIVLLAAQKLVDSQPQAQPASQRGHQQLDSVSDLLHRLLSGVSK